MNRSIFTILFLFLLISCESKIEHEKKVKYISLILTNFNLANSIQDSMLNYIENNKTTIDEIFDKKTYTNFEFEIYNRCCMFQLKQIELSNNIMLIQELENCTLKEELTSYVKSIIELSNSETPLDVENMKFEKPEKKYSFLEKKAKRKIKYLEFKNAIYKFIFDNNITLKEIN